VDVVCDGVGWAVMDGDLDGDCVREWLGEGVLL